MSTAEGGSSRGFRGDRLKLARRHHQMSLDQLSAKVNVSKGYLSNLENGQKKNPGLDLLRRLAAALQVSLGYLLGESDEM